jgi:hypothetical protein
MAVAPTYVSQLIEGKTVHVVGDVKSITHKGTVGAADTYVTNGFAVAPATFGLQSIVQMDPVVFSTGHWGYYEPSTGLIKVFSAAGTELVNASAALQNATFWVNATGK